MAKTNQNHHEDNASSSTSRKRLKTFDKARVGPWSNLNNDVLFIIMMQLGVVDFIAFSGVCKSWRSFALPNKKMFMASKPPMMIFDFSNDEDSYWHLEDFKGRSFKTKIPHSRRRTCFGLTCGYMVFFGTKNRDFWLVNPITRHQLHFPDYPFPVKVAGFTAILVFSPSISTWVLVVLHRPTTFDERGKRKFSFCIAGKRRWNHVSSTVPIIDLHVFKGKIHILHIDGSLGELRLNLNQKRKGTLLTKTNMIFPKLALYSPELVSSGEKLYMKGYYTRLRDVLELNFGEMKWVSPEKTIEEYAFFESCLRYSAVIKPESWVGPRTKYKSYACFFEAKSRRHRDRWYYNRMWYFPHDCLNVNLLDE